MTPLPIKTKISKLIKTAAYHKTVADREWAYAKNGKGEFHYGKARDHYNQAAKLLDYAKELCTQNDIRFPSELVKEEKDNG